MLRLVESFATHPPQRTRKDGAPPLSAEITLPAPVGRLVSFRRVGSAVYPVPRSRREGLTADNLETIIRFFPLGSRLFVSVR
jgi:hypothetical protein